MSSGDIPQGVATAVVVTVTAVWGLSIVGQLFNFWHTDPGINGIMGAAIAFLGIAFGKSKLPRNTIRSERSEDAGKDDDG